MENGKILSKWGYMRSLCDWQFQKIVSNLIKHDYLSLGNKIANVLKNILNACGKLIRTCLNLDYIM